MRVIFLNTPDEIAQWVAHYIIYRINVFNPTNKKPFVLGLPAGSTPMKTYKNLIKLHQNGKISFKHVIVFMMDEYLGVSNEDSKSYHKFIYKNFINHIDIMSKNVHILNGNTENLQNECQKYEEKIKSYGCVNLFMGGVGNDGHLAFNEPGSALTSRTRIQTLSYETRLSNSRFFNNQINFVPKFALTIGLATLLESQEIIIVATGQDKANAVHAAIEGSINHMWPISCLQLHPKSILVCDELSTMELKIKTIKHFQNMEINNDQIMCDNILKKHVRFN